MTSDYYGELTKHLQVVAKDAGVVLGNGSARLNWQNGFCVSAVFLPRVTLVMNGSQCARVKTSASRILRLSKERHGGESFDAPSEQVELKLEDGAVADVRFTARDRKKKKGRGKKKK